MAGTISFGGIGSGMDTEGIVSGLVSASSGALSTLKSRASSTRSAVSTLSDISSLLAKLKTSVEALASPQDVQSFKTTSSNAAIVASANGLATAGSYSVNIKQMAKEQRSYSDPFASQNTALGQVGTLKLQVGTGTAKDIEITATDSLESIASKISGAGLRVSSSLFFDGNQYRIQLRGLDTGAENAVAITETGITLGLSKSANRFQQAQDAKVEIDGHIVNRPTNQIQGAIPGVTLAITDELTTAPVKVTVDADPGAMKTKLQSVVDAYNSVMSKTRLTAGYGSVKASNPVLAGDSTLRSITNRLSEAMLKQVPGSGQFKSLGQVGLSLSRDGVLSLDSTKFEKALAADPSSVRDVLAGAGTSNGAMDVMRDVIASFTTTGTGLIASRTQSLEERAKALETRATNEQKRLDRYADQLRKQFTQMDSAVATNNAMFNYLAAFGQNNSSK